MSHAEETTLMWDQLAWIESVCDRWEGFFYALVDEPDRAEALCILGIRAVSGQTTSIPQSVNSRWMSLFGSLAGKARVTSELCEFGLRIVRSGLPRDSEGVRGQVRDILKSTMTVGSVA